MPILPSATPTPAIKIPAASPAASGTVSPQPSASPSGSPLPDGATDITEGVGWNSPTFNHGNGVYVRNIKGTQSAACAQPLSVNEISMNMLVMTRKNGSAVAIAGQDETFWTTRAYSLQSHSRKLKSSLPPPTDWIPFDQYTGHFKVTNGGRNVSALDQCFAISVRRSLAVYDQATFANSNVVAGYNDPDFKSDKYLLNGKVRSLTIPNLVLGGTGAFELDNGWKGEISITDYASAEIGGYAYGIDTVGDSYK